MAKMKKQRIRWGRGDIQPPDYSTATTRLRQKRREEFQAAQDVLTGFDQAVGNLPRYADNAGVWIDYNGKQYRVRLVSDSDSGYDTDQGFSVERHHDGLDRGDWCHNPDNQRNREEVIVLDKDCQLASQYKYGLQRKLGKAAAMDAALYHRARHLEHACKVQTGDYYQLGVIVEDEAGREESLWGVELDGVEEVVRDLLDQFN